MEENKELQELLLRIEKAGQKQVKFARWQCIFSALSAVCCLAVLVLVLAIVPRLSGIVTQVNGVIGDVETVTAELAQADWEGLVEDMEAVSQQLAAADLGGIVQEVNGLVQTSRTGVEETMKKLNAIDFDTLNEAIRDLSDVVEPLAKFANKFK